MTNEKDIERARQIIAHTNTAIDNMDRTATELEAQAKALRKQIIELNRELQKFREQFPDVFNAI